MLFTSDLRVGDNPALAAAGHHVVPLFVFDERVFAGPFAAPNRISYLLDALGDLRTSLRAAGSDLVIRSGDVVAETMKVADDTKASALHLSDDVSRFAHNRLERLTYAADDAGIEIRSFEQSAVIGAADLQPSTTGASGGYKVFTPYWRRWSAAPSRDVSPTPTRLTPVGIDPGEIPRLAQLCGDAQPSPRVRSGGETAEKAAFAAWSADGIEHYGDRRDFMAVEGTSRLSAALHFGCMSTLTAVTAAQDEEGGEALVRQICWRDFHRQFLAHRPEIADSDYRPRPYDWRDDPEGLAAWKAGRTGYPLVDAGMRQLSEEGWMHNRLRMLCASFLTKHLRIDWRLGARHFIDLLVDGDIANNQGNWQWVAGTGAASRPNRVLSPIRQTKRFDPHAEFIRRYLPELAPVGTKALIDPSLMTVADRRMADYPQPIVDHDEATAELAALVKEPHN